MKEFEEIAHRMSNDGKLREKYYGQISEEILKLNNNHAQLYEAVN